MTGAADALLARPGGGGLARLVYVNAMVPWPGESWSSQHTPAVIAEREAIAAAHDNALPAFATIAGMRRRVLEQPGWQVREIPTGHCPMVSQPEALVALLLEFAAA